MKTTENTVLITGGTSGIGLALARRFWQAKNDVIVIGRDKTKLANAQKALPGIQAESIDVCDVSALAQLPERYPHVNILVNNAAVQYLYDFADANQPLALITAEINTNILAPLHLTKLFLPQLLSQKEAAIINVSSALGFVPKQSAPVYCASKAALHTFSKSLRWQLESTAVKVFEIVPSLVDTPMTQGQTRHKISAEELVAEFWHSFQSNKEEIHIANVKQLLLLNKLMPHTAEKLMRRR